MKASIIDSRKEEGGSGVKLGTLFSGGGGYDIGAMMAGVNPVWAVEHNQRIAGVYTDNVGDHVRVGDILEMMPDTFDYVDIIHASPPCTRFSTANHDGEAGGDMDNELLVKTLDIIQWVKPIVFTFENVMQVLNYPVFDYMVQRLYGLGYNVRWWVLNSANYGVAQTRRRLILIARRDGIIPTRPKATHEKTPKIIGGLTRWIGWYDALINTKYAERTNLTEFQLTRAVDDCIVDKGNTSSHTHRHKKDPCFTVTANFGSHGNWPQIFINDKFFELTPKQSAALQSFPDTYKLPKGKGLAGTLVGNAVPPLLAKAIVSSLNLKKTETKLC